MNTNMLSQIALSTAKKPYFIKCGLWAHGQASIQGPDCPLHSVGLGGTRPMNSNCRASVLCCKPKTQVYIVLA